MVVLYAVVFGSLALIRHWAFHSTALDLGVFDQVLWNTVHGRFMESTLSLERCDPHSFFLDHFSPALLLIVPFYAVFQRPETLIVFQTAALALGAWPVYLMARHYLPRGGGRLVWVAVYVLSAPLAWITFYDFHEITIAVLPLGLAMYFLATRRTIPFLLTLFVPGLGLALRARSALIPSIVPLGYLLLSNYGGQHTHHNQYGAPVIPLALGASIIGFATLRVGPRLRRRLTGAVLVSAVAFSLVHGAIPFTPDFYDA